MVMEAIPFGPINTLTQHGGHAGSGLYLLTGVAEHIGASGQTHLQLTLEDATDRAIGFVWPEARGTAHCPTPPAPVAIRAIVQFHVTG